MSDTVIIQTSQSTVTEERETTVLVTTQTSNVIVDSPAATSVTVSPVGLQGNPGPPGTNGYSEGTAGETISVYKVIAITGSSIVVADPTNLAHAGKVAGVAIQSANAGSALQYVQIGTILGGSWTPGTVYYLGLAGNLSTTPRAVGAAFQQAMGVGQTSSSFSIIPSPPLLLE